jgi:phosphatidylglycerophosphate synthase
MSTSAPKPGRQSQRLEPLINNVAKLRTDHSSAHSIHSTDPPLDALNSPSPHRGAACTLAAATLIVCIATAALSVSAGLGNTVALAILSLWACVVILVWQGLAHHPHSRFGPANTVTTARAVATVILAGLIPVAELLSRPDMSIWLWTITICAIVTLSLDGLDGYLARKTALSSEMGARFDMEVDSLLALVIALFLWQSGELGFWILGLGIMRYAFVLASVWLTPLTGDLYPSMRRKTVCVIQLAALCAVLSPLIQPPLSIAIGIIALICLTASFTRDIRWLYTKAQ